MLTQLKDNSEAKLLIEGLQDILAWKRQGDDLCRKLSSLAIVARTFQSQMESLMTTEEGDGYMDIVLKEQPDLSNAVEVLRQDHDEFREELGLALSRLAQFPSKSQICLTQICANMTEWLRKLDDDSEIESDNFHEAFERDEGGEG